MQRRLTISIPEDLHIKMQKWSDSFNFSKEFRRHITALIEKKERYHQQLKEDANMEQIIERLGQEKAEAEKGREDQGKSDGVAWAKTAHYDEILYVLAWNTDDPPNTDTIEGERLYKYFIEVFNEDPVFGLNDNEYEFWKLWVNENTVPYLGAWQEGVVDFWEEVKDKI